MNVALEGLPATSAPLPWQAQPWDHLGVQREQNQMPQSLLLLGPAQSGKTRFALALARLLLCVQPKAGLNCGRCRPCELSAAGSNGDLRWLQPGDKSRVIKTDQVRDAITFSRGTAMFSPSKVIVFSPANSMNMNAHNALLKSLEEPVSNTYLILVCDSLHGVPATIRSRCQLLRLPSPDRESSLHWLQQTIGDASIAASLLELADGRPMLAEGLYQEGLAQDYAEQRLALRALLENQVSVTQIWNSYRDRDSESFLELLASELRFQLKALPADQLTGVRGRALFGMLDQALQLQRAIAAGSNPGGQLLVDLMLSKCHRELGESRQDDNI